MDDHYTLFNEDEGGELEAHKRTNQWVAQQTEKICPITNKKCTVQCICFMPPVVGEVGEGTYMATMPFCSHITIAFI